MQNTIISMERKRKMPVEQLLEEEVGTRAQNLDVLKMTRCAVGRDSQLSAIGASWQGPEWRCCQPPVCFKHTDQDCASAILSSEKGIPFRPWTKKAGGGYCCKLRLLASLSKGSLEATRVCLSAGNDMAAGWEGQSNPMPSRDPAPVTQGAEKSRIAGQDAGTRSRARRARPALAK